MWTLARPLVGVRAPPTAVTVVGVGLAVLAPVIAARLPLAALALVVAAALCDGLDGAVAVVGERATRAGAIADSIADRLADTAFALTLWSCGAPLWLALLAGGLNSDVRAGENKGRRLRHEFVVLNLVNVFTYSRVLLYTL